jgi:hypothetical protein
LHSSCQGEPADNQHEINSLLKTARGQRIGLATMCPWRRDRMSRYPSGRSGTPAAGAAAKLGIQPATLDYRIKTLKFRKRQFKYRRVAPDLFDLHRLTRARSPVQLTRRISSAQTRTGSWNPGSCRISRDASAGRWLELRRTAWFRSNRSPARPSARCPR